MGSRRRLVATALSAVAILVLAACDVASPTPIGGTDPSTTTTTLAPTPPSSTSTQIASRTGISTGGGLLWESDAELTRDMDAIAASGAKWVRVDFDWNSVQWDGPTSFRWDRAQDRVVSAAKARGLKVLGILAYSPPWARRPICSGTKFCLPANPDDYARFAGKAAERYGSNSTVSAFRATVGAWEIWNEPNHYPFVQPTVDIPGYATMLKKSYPAIKAADPNATVVTGGTAPAPNDPGGKDVAPVNFVDGLYANGAQHSFDAVGHHPYSFPYSPLYSASWNAFTQTQTIHDHMAARGDGAKKIWATEAGAATGTQPGMSVSEATQAQYVKDYFKGWFGDYASFAGPLFWFQHRDNGTNLGYYDDNFGLLHHDWSPKPAYAVFQQQTAS